MTHKLRVLHVNTLDHGGGAAQLATNLVEGLNATGCHASLAVRAKTTGNPDVFDIANDPSRHGWARLCAKVFRRPDGSQRLARAIGRPWNTARVLLGHEDFDFPGTWHLLDDASAQPDLIHLHNLHGNYFDLRALPWLSRQIPTVVTLHDAWLVAGHCSHGFDCERWRTGCGQCPNLDTYPAIRRDATAYNWRRKQNIYARSRLHVVSPCQWLMRKAKDSMLAPAMVSSRVIPHGIDLTIFQTGDHAEARHALGLPQDATILLFAAKGIRDNSAKDFDTMSRALQILGTQVTDKRLIFVALGEDSPTEIIGNAELRFLPHVSDRHAVARYYQAADIYVHGARAEVWGLSITEAMACGLPVVASDVGGIPDQVAEGQTGFLVPIGDAEQMADSISGLLDDIPARQAMGRRACKRAHAEFGISTMTQNYLAYYASIIGREPSPNTAF